MIKPVLVIIFLLLFNPNVFSKSKTNQILLPNFRWHPGDNVEWAKPSFNDKDWEMLPNRQFPFQKWTGIGWFRYLLIPDPFMNTMPLGISLIPCGAVELYLDGQLIATYGKVSTSGKDEEAVLEWSLKPIVFNNHKILKNNLTTHLLAIRYSNHTFNQTVWSGYRPRFKFKLGQISQLTRERTSLLNKVSSHQLALMSICLAFALLHFLLYLFYVRLKANFYFALLTAAAALNMFFEFNPHIAVDLADLLKSQIFAQISFLLFGMFCLRFILSILYHKKPESFLIFLYAGIGISIMVFFKPFALDSVLHVYMLAVIIQIIISIIQTRKSKKPYEGIWIIGIGAIPLILFTLFEICAGTGLIERPWRFTDFPSPYYGMLGFLIGMSIFLARQFAKINNNLEVQIEQVRQLSKKTLAQERQAKKIAVEKTRLETEIKQKNQELEAARKLQLSMLPHSVPLIPYLDIAAGMKTAAEVGGDYYDFMSRENEKLTVAIGDATGHGMHSGIMVAAAKSLINLLSPDPHPANILKKTSYALSKMGFRSMFMAMAIAKIDNRELILASAGMPFPLIYKKKLKMIKKVELKGLPLGSKLKFDYREKKIKLEQGDTLLFMSDGLIESFNRKGEMFGEKRVKQSFIQWANHSSQIILDRLILESKKWRNGQELQDDMTIVVMKIK
jgi:serine phosphatase RsbU (regulator of sigma subunit)